MLLTIDRVSKKDFDTKGIVRINFSRTMIKEKKEEIIGEFKKRGFMGGITGELKICGGFDGHGNEFVLFDTARYTHTEALDWIKKHSYETSGLN